MSPIARLAVFTVAMACSAVGTANSAPPNPVANEDEAGRLLAKSVQLLDAGHPVEARVELEKVLQLVPDKPNPYRLIGIIDFRLGHCREAIGELETFLAKVGPNDRRVTEVMSIRDKCKEDLAPKLGTLMIDSTPRGAKVRLDDERGEVVGVTPYTNNALPAGPHVVFVEAEGFRASSRGFQLQKSERLRLEFGLQKEAEATVSEKVLPPPKPVYKRGWFWGVLVTVVAVGAGVGVGVALGTQPAKFEPNVGPPFRLALRF